MHTRTLRAISHAIVAGAALLLAWAGAEPGTAGAHAQSGSAWTLYSFNNGSNLTAQSVAAGPGAVAAFAVPTTPSAALLTTTQNAGSTRLVGDLTGRTLSATIGITVTSGSPVYAYGNRATANACTQPATVRLYFGTRRYNPNYVSSSTETSWWWSNPISLSLQSISSGNGTMTVALQPGNWSDALGHLGSNAGYATPFAAAVRSVVQIGFSFGGGCYFDNGVGVAPGSGSASFHVASLTSS